MERLLGVVDIMDRYRCSRQTAIRYMRRMEHQEKPYAVTERALTEWERSRTIRPADQIRQELRRQRAQRRMA